MTAILVDSNVLLDLMTEDRRWLSWSADAVEKAADRFRLVINPIIYAEVSIRYSRIEDLEAALPKAMLDREAIPYEAAFLAGKCFLVYRQREGTKQSPLPDFFIGAHAAVAGYRLIGYEDRMLRDEDFNDDKKDAGEIGAGHSVTALYEIVPAGVEVPAAKVDKLKYQTPSTAATGSGSELMTVKVRYKPPTGAVSRLLSETVADAIHPEIALMLLPCW